MNRNRGSICAAIGFTMILCSCAPVLNRDVMREGSRELSFAALRENPEPYMGRLYVFGGIIVNSSFTASGSQIEAVHVPVDGLGYFKESGQSQGRFLAVLPKDAQMLDPEVYRRGRRVTLAGEFVATQSGKIEDMDYRYPVFQIRQIYLWPRQRPYNPPGYYYDPWFYPFPYYYGAPWWSNYYIPMRPLHNRTYPSGPHPREQREPARR